VLDVIVSKLCSSSMICNVSGASGSMMYRSSGTELSPPKPKIKSKHSKRSLNPAYVYQSSGESGSREGARRI
jgi:hypothetical protein